MKNRFLQLTWTLIIVLAIGIIVSSCKEKKDSQVLTVATDERDLPSGIAGDLISELDTNLKSAGYSDAQATIICDGAIASVDADSLNESTDTTTVVPIVLKGAIASLSDANAGISTSDQKLVAIDVIIDSIAQSLNGRLTPSSKLNSVSTGPNRSSMGSVHAAMMRLLASVAVQQLDEAGIPTNAMVNAIKQVSKFLIKSLRKAGVTGDDLAAVARAVTTAAVGTVDETGLTGTQVETAIEAVVAGVMNGLKDYGADSDTIAATADDVAAGAVDGLLSAGISNDDATTYISTITEAVSTGAKEAGLTDSEVSAIEQNIEDAANDVINSLPNAKSITAFSFTATANSVLSADVTATISGTNITATVPLETNVTALIATFTITGESVSVRDTTQVSGTTANNFSSVVTYTVTAADGSTQDYAVSVQATAQSTDYFKYNEGHGIRYHVTDEDGSFDVNAWAVSQYHENDKSHNLDFVFTLNRESAGNLDNSLGGKLNQNIDGVGLTRFQSGYPCGNQGNFYMNFSLPNSFYSGMQWSLSWGPIAYSVEYVGSQTINGTTFPDSIKVYIDDSSNDSDYLKGTGYFILAKDIGIVQIVFNRTNGNTVQFDYMTHGQLTKHVISGIVEVTSGNAAVGKIVQISNGNWGIRSVTAADGSFSIEAYGPDIMLRIGDDTNNDDVLDFDPEMPKQVWVNDITSNVTVPTIVLTP